MSSPVSTKVHSVSQAAYGQQKAELYEAYEDVSKTTILDLQDEFIRARPSYAPEVLSHIRKVLQGREELRIVDLACGTGKLTGALLGHPEWTSSIVEIKGIDPNDDMRAVFVKAVKDPRASVSAGTFDDTGVPDNWADLITVASAFHWCLHLEAAMKEFMRILKPDGVVCFLWNPEDVNGAAWMKQIYDLCMPKRGNMPSGAEGLKSWRQIFDLQLYKENFSTHEDTAIKHTEPTTLERYTALLMTWSGIAILPDDEKEDLKEQIRAIVERGDELVWVDKERGVFELPRVTPVVIFRRAQPRGA